jgi:hypothetical protein
MNEQKLELKLYVVGDVSGNPDDWCDRPVGRCLVLASSVEEAVAIADCGCEAMIVIADSAVLLSRDN